MIAYTLKQWKIFGDILNSNYNINDPSQICNKKSSGKVIMLWSFKINNFLLRCVHQYYKTLFILICR